MVKSKKGGIENVFDIQKVQAEPLKPQLKNITKFTFDLTTAAKKQLDFMSVEHDKTRKNLLSEALNDLFEKYGKQPLA